MAITSNTKKNERKQNKEKEHEMVKQNEISEHEAVPRQTVRLAGGLSGRFPSTWY